MKFATTFAYPISVFLAGDHDKALELCRAYCDEVGFCVTVTPTTYVYTDGQESGVVIGLINYSRFPSTPKELWTHARRLAEVLREGLEQQSFTIQTPHNSEWYSWREE